VSDKHFKLFSANNVEDMVKKFKAGEEVIIPTSDLTIQQNGQILQFEYIYQKMNKPKTELCEGIFNLEATNQGIILVETSFPKLNLLETSSVTTTIKTEINTFFDKIDVYTKLGIPPRRGVLIFGPPGVGKCLGPEVEVMKYDGSIVRSDSIRTGDLLMGPDSTARRVLGVSTGREEMFRITPTKGKSWTCNRSHVLSLRCNTDVNSIFKKDQIYNISVNEYLELPNSIKHHLKLWKTSVNFKQQEVPFDPYLVGVWLAEGTVGHNNFTSGDDDVIDEVNNILKDDSILYTRAVQNDINCKKVIIKSRINKNNPFRQYVKNNLYINGEKRIPKEYLINNRETQLKLLAGFLDGDGSLTNGCYDVITKYPGLAEDLMFLTRTLGLTCTSRIKKVKLKDWDEPREYVRLTISGNCSEIPLKVSRKKATPRTINKNNLNVGFSIESIGEGDYYGVELDGDHLYLLSDTTVTHNTSSIGMACNEMSSEGACIITWNASALRSSDVLDFFTTGVKYHPNVKRLILIIEDIGMSVENYGGPKEIDRSLLNLLDGGANVVQIPTLNIATTNYAHNLPEPLVRPGRFDSWIEAKLPTAKERVCLVEFISKTKLTDEDKQIIMSKELDTFSAAHLKELSIRSVRDGKSFSEVIKELKDHQKRFKNAFEDKKGFGLL
jgi:SpoVK/Ycf46/Vps4 family AAA+-type ATPase